MRWGTGLRPIAGSGRAIDGQVLAERELPHSGTSGIGIRRVI